MRHKLKPKLICLFIITFCLLNVSLIQTGVDAKEPKEPSRPAVIGIIDTTGDKGRLANVISLMTVRLSEESDINLVEREEINTVLKELGLSASQLTSRENALKLGRLLRTDGLVFLSLSDDAKILRARLVDTRYGLRLLDTLAEWKEEELERIVEEIAPCISRVSSKLLIPPRKKLLIGILSIRNVDPSSRLNWLELALPGLISSKLSSEPRIIVLEREDLNLILEEKLFTKGADTKFLGSMALLEGEVKQISTKDDHHFSLSLDIKEADGKSIGHFKIRANIEKLPELTEEVGTWLVKAVTDSRPQGKWDVKREASRFFEEGKVLMAHWDYAAARPLIETAHALHPESEAIVEALLEVLPWGRSPLEDAQVRHRKIELLSVQLQRGMRGEKVLSNLLSIWGCLNSGSSVKTEELRALNRQTRRYCRDLSERAYLSRKISTDWYWKMRYPLCWASAVSETPEEAMKRVRKAMSKLLLRPEKGGYPPDRKWLSRLHECLTSYNQYHILSAGHLDRKEVLKLWLGFLEELSKSEDPAVKIMAELGFSATFRDSPRPPEFYEHAKKVMKILYEELNYPHEPFTLRGRAVLHYAVRDGILSLTPYRSSPEVWIDQVENILEPLIDKNDMENLLTWTPIFMFGGIGTLKCDAAVGKRILNLLDSVIKALEDTDKDLADRVYQESGFQFSAPSKQVATLRDRRVRFLKFHPEIKSARTPSSGLKVSILCDLNEYLTEQEAKSRWSMYWNKGTIQGNILWLSFQGKKGGGNEAWLVGIDLEHRSLHSFWRSSYPGSLALTKPVVCTDAIYVGVPGTGIVKFPGSSEHDTGRLENLDAITTKDGLPSNSVSGLARVGSKLYVSLGSVKQESGFGVYDLEQKTWKTISSSRSKDRSCPLNVERPYRLISLTPTPDGKKLFFVCEQPNGPLQGLWKMDLESGKLEHIWRTGWRSGHNIFPGEKHWWIRGNGMSISFDPDSETGNVVVCQRYYGGRKPWIKAAAGRKPPSMDKCVYVDKAHLRCEYSGLFDDVFWSLTGASQEHVPCCIFVKKPAQDLKWLSVDILGENWITGLYPTPYGMVVVGRNKIGLIEENPEP